MSHDDQCRQGHSKILLMSNKIESQTWTSQQRNAELRVNFQSCEKSVRLSTV